MVGGILSLFLATAAFAEPVKCIGPQDAGLFVVYLHGLDSAALSDTEKKNREIFERLAKKLNVGFVLPRATHTCPVEGGETKFCWGSGESFDAEAPKVVEKSLKLGSECFPKGKPLTLLGFSNGGYIVNRVLLNCMDTPFSFLVTSGSDGTIKNKRDLSRCGNFTILVGKGDSIYASTKNFAAQLKNQGAHVQIDESNGSHEIPESALEDFLSAQSRSYKMAVPRKSWPGTTR